MKAQEFEKYAGKRTKGKKGNDNLSGGKIIGYDPKDVHRLQLFAIDDSYGDSGRMFEVVIPDKDDLKDYLCGKHKYIWVTIENVIMDELKEITNKTTVMETRNVKMTLETAKCWKAMGGEYEQVAVETFPELAVKNEWVEKFENKEISGFYVAQISEIRKYDESHSTISDMNLFKTEKQAKSALAYAQLTQLMALPEYNGDWAPNWRDSYATKYVIKRGQSSIFLDAHTCIYEPISFKSKEIRDKFLENNRDLLKQYFEL